MNLSRKKVGGILFTILFWVWTATDRLLNWIGRSTAPEDWEILMSEKLPGILEWLFSTPWWVPAGLATGFSVWLMRPEKKAVAKIEHEDRQLIDVNSEAPTLERPNDTRLTDAERNGIYDGAHEDLRRFVNDHIVPCANLLHSIQGATINSHIGNEFVSKLIDCKLVGDHDVWKFQSGLEALTGMSASPAEFIYFDEMIGAAHTIEQTYRTFADQANELASSLDFSVKDDPLTSQQWSDWREEHEQLVEAYEAIKQDSRMKTSDGECTLFRPAKSRVSRWGRLVPINDVDIGSQFLLPPDTGPEKPR